VVDWNAVTFFHSGTAPTAHVAVYRHGSPKISGFSRGDSSKRVTKELVPHSPAAVH
jgi:hypothetical protein